MATVAWTDEARQRIEDIFEYVAAVNPQAAARTVQGIYERAQVPVYEPSLTGFPR